MALRRLLLVVAVLTVAGHGLPAVVRWATVAAPAAPASVPAAPCGADARLVFIPRGSAATLTRDGGCRPAPVDLPGDYGVQVNSSGAVLLYQALALAAPVRNVGGNTLVAADFAGPRVQDTAAEMAVFAATGAVSQANGTLLLGNINDNKGEKMMMKEENYCRSNLRFVIVPSLFLLFFLSFRFFLFVS